MLARVRPRTFSLSASLIAALACALPSPSHAQTTGTVTGRVTRTDGQPLAEVVVAIQGTGRAVATSATGRYALAHVPLGEHVLQFRLIGYAPDTMTVHVSAGSPTIADAVLEARPILLGTIFVEGVSRAPDRMIDAPAAVDVVRPTTGEPVSITGQIPLALARVPGLDVVQSGVNDFDVNARGFNATLNRKLLVLQDGRDLATGTSGQPIWGTLSEPLEDLGRIEVIRGPGSALYGANAFNGVINITTPAARDVVGTKLTLGGGELGTTRADLRQAGVLLHDRIGYRLNLGYSRSDDWSQARTAKDSSDWKQEYAPATATPPRSPGPEAIPLIGQTKDPVTGEALGTPDPLVATYGSARVDYYAANRSMVTFEGGTARVDNSVTIAGNGRQNAAQILRPWARVAWDAKGSSLSAWFTGRGGPRFLRLSSGTTVYSHEGIFHVEGRTSRTFRGDAGRVVVGASVQDNQVNTEGTLFGLVNDDRSDRSYGAYAQLDYRVFRILHLIGAVRWDKGDLFAAQVSPKGALVVTPTKNHALRLSVNRAFLTPSLNNLFFSAPAGPGASGVNLTAIEAGLRAGPVGPALAAVPNGTLFTNSAAVPESAFGNPLLVPQTVTSYEVGYKGQFGPRVFITVDAYDAHIENFTTGQLPAVPVGAAPLNPKYQPWTAPPEVLPADTAAVVAAVRNALASLPNTVRNGLTRLPDGTTAIILSYGNVGTVDEWGVELGSSVSLTRALTFSASYTWYDFAIRSGDAAFLVPNTPHHKGSVALDYAGRQGVTVGVDARIVAGYHWTSGIWDGDVPASQIVNVRAGYRINPHLRVYANATDLLDQQRFQFYGGSVIGRRVLAGMTSTF